MKCEVLAGALLELLHSASLKYLVLKTACLLAITSAATVRELQVLHSLPVLSLLVKSYAILRLNPVLFPSLVLLIIAIREVEL
jgi:hypothetical protein